jgi:N-acetylglucosaminyldiphosphoundecaprenol N-acetyl-beta-D-mannosaminyltransferase
LGVGVHVLNLETAVEAIEAAVTHQARRPVGVEGVTEVPRAAPVKDPFDHALIVAPDAVSIAGMREAPGPRESERAYGSDFMLEVCRRSVERGATHFIFGGSEAVVQILTTELRTRFPGIRIVGFYTPPFRPLELEEESELIALVEAAKPDLFWVAMNTAKQRKVMETHLTRLSVKVMLGVGAAIDVQPGAPRVLRHGCKESESTGHAVHYRTRAASSGAV